MKQASAATAALPLNQRACDFLFIFSCLGLVVTGLLMVTSASMAVSSHQFGHPFHFLWHQVTYLGLAIALMIMIFPLPMRFWQKLSPLILLLCIILLILVLVPGLGRQLNGSQRWLGLSGFGLQVSELAKLALILYFASFIARKQKQIEQNFKGFLVPIFILALMGFLLLLEPDFGATFVISVTALGLLFLAGARLRYFSVLLIVCAALLAILAITSPYRLLRLTSFLDPWQHQFGSGYQLTQSLIAFGRGGISGIGLGNSIQKLFYLPEAHTDFLFAVLAEELGLFGTVFVVFLFSVLVYRIFAIGKKAFERQDLFSAFCAYGIALWIGIQAMINIGVNAGLLPTKGLTLPLMSYGGSSMLILSLSLALILRIDYENRHQ